MIKAPVGLKHFTYRFVTNALTLLGNSIGKEKKNHIWFFVIFDGEYVTVCKCPIPPQTKLNQQIMY